MNERQIHGFCAQHCKEEVYSKNQIEKMLQELEAGTLATLAWYKGANKDYHYEFLGSDPNTITLNTYTNLLIAMLSDCANLKAEDMTKILAVENMAVKLWHNGNEYYAVKLDDKLVLTKTNLYIREFDADGNETTTNWPTNKDIEAINKEITNLKTDLSTLNANTRKISSRTKTVNQNELSSNIIYDATDAEAGLLLQPILNNKNMSWSEAVGVTMTLKIYHNAMDFEITANCMWDNYANALGDEAYIEGKATGAYYEYNATYGDKGETILFNVRMTNEAILKIHSVNSYNQTEVVKAWGQPTKITVERLVFHM